MKDISTTINSAAASNNILDMLTKTRAPNQEQQAADAYDFSNVMNMEQHGAEFLQQRAPQPNRSEAIPERDSRQPELPTGETPQPAPERAEQAEASAQAEAEPDAPDKADDTEEQAAAKEETSSQENAATEKAPEQGSEGQEAAAVAMEMEKAVMEEIVVIQKVVVEETVAVENVETAKAAGSSGESSEIQLKLAQLTGKEKEIKAAAEQSAAVETKEKAEAPKQVEKSETGRDELKTAVEPRSREANEADESKTSKLTPRETSVQQTDTKLTGKNPVDNQNGNQTEAATAPSAISASEKPAQDAADVSNAVRREASETAQVSPAEATDAKAKAPDQGREDERVQRKAKSKPTAEQRVVQEVAVRAGPTRKAVRVQTSKQDSPLEQDLGVKASAGPHLTTPMAAERAQEVANVRSAVFARSLDANHLIDNILQQSRLLSRPDGSAELRVTLRPPELGTVVIRLTMRNDQLTARLLVDTAVVRNIVEDMFNRIKESLASEGFDLEEFNVGLRNQMDPQDEQDEDQPDGDEDNDAAAVDELAGKAHPKTVAPGRSHAEMTLAAGRIDFIA